MNTGILHPHLIETIMQPFSTPFLKGNADQWPVGVCIADTAYDERKLRLLVVHRPFWLPFETIIRAEDAGAFIISMCKFVCKVN